MLTVGNDLVRHQLHQQRNKYLMIGGLLIAFAILLLGSLPFTTFSMVVFFGLLLMFAAFLHMIAAFLFFEGGIRVLWLIFAIAYFVAGSIVFQHPWSTAQFLTQLLGGVFVIAGGLRMIKAWLFRVFQGWCWILLSGFLTTLTGLLILVTPHAAVWLLGLCFAIDLLVQGLNYLNLAAVIHQIPSSSADS